MNEDELPKDFVDALLSRAEASKYLASIGIRRRVSTLAKVHSLGTGGPPCVIQGRKPLYPKRDLHAWGMRQLVNVRRTRRPPANP